MTPAGAGMSGEARPTWAWWEAIPVFFIASLLGGLVARAATAGLARGTRFLVTLLILDVALGAMVALWLVVFHRGAFRAIGVPSRALRELAVGLAAGAGIYAVAVFGLAVLASQVLEALSGRPVDVPDQLPVRLVGGRTALAAAAVVIAAPAAEELFFRGLFFRGLRGRYGFVVSAVASAVAFGAAHYTSGPWEDSFLLVAVLAFVGFGLAYVYERRRNILAPIAAHAMFNLIGFAVIAGGLR